MVDIRIVCARDAVKTAETLRRLLEAEQHRVEVSFGRHSLDQFEPTREAGEAVVLIWSPNAPGAHYMFEWAERFDRKRLIEVATSPGWPELARAAPVIDFVNWNGTRGSRAWVVLSERLKPFARAREVKAPPPRQAFMALGFAAAAAMVGAVVVRVQDGGANGASAPPQRDALHVTASDGVGGPFERLASEAVEPASVEDATMIIPPHIAPLPQLDLALDMTIADVPNAPTFVIRQPTLLERLSELNPLQLAQRRSAETSRE